MQGQFARAFGSRRRDIGLDARVLKDVLLEFIEVAGAVRFGDGGGLGLGSGGLLDLSFDLADGPTLFDRPVGERLLDLRVFYGGQSPGVAHGEALGAEMILDGGAELEESQQVGDGGAFEPDLLAELFVAQAMALDEFLQGSGAFDGVEVFPLEVLDEGPLGGLLVFEVLEQGGDLFEPCEPGGAPASFAGDDLVPPCLARLGSDGDGLHDALGLDGVGEFLQACGVEILTRLEGIGLEIVEREAMDGVTRLGIGLFGRLNGGHRGRGHWIGVYRDGLADKACEPFSKTRWTFGGHSSPP